MVSSGSDHVEHATVSAVGSGEGTMGPLKGWSNPTSPWSWMPNGTWYWVVDTRNLLEESEVGGWYRGGQQKSKRRRGRGGEVTAGVEEGMG